jgi:hypothetical protein
MVPTCHRFVGNAVMNAEVKTPVLFLLVRDEDETGVSGTGVVAKGVELANGSCLMKWTVGPAQSIVLYESMTDLVRIHGHGGKTKAQYLPDPGANQLEQVGAIVEKAIELVQSVSRAALAA